jgi:class 3 adenylate cyclase
MDTKESRPEFAPTKRVITLIDLAGSTKAFQSKGDVEMAALFQQYYTDCETVLTTKGGTVIKFMGDACLATFPPDQAKNAVEAVLELQSKVTVLSEHYQVSIELGANLHLASAVEAEFGAGASRARDILGRGVNQTFLLGRGAGIRISEPVYRALPSTARSPWRKYKPPAVYHLDERAEGIYEGMGKDPATNAERW